MIVQETRAGFQSSRQNPPLDLNALFIRSPRGCLQLKRVANGILTYLSSLHSHRVLCNHTLTTPHSIYLSQHASLYISASSLTSLNFSFNLPLSFSLSLSSFLFPCICPHPSPSFSFLLSHSLFIFSLSPFLLLFLPHFLGHSYKGLEALNMEKQSQEPNLQCVVFSPEAFLPTIQILSSCVLLCHLLFYVCSMYFVILIASKSCLTCGAAGSSWDELFSTRALINKQERKWQKPDFLKLTPYFMSTSFQ